MDGNCDVQIEKNNTFRKNKASDDGGAIIWITNNFVDDETNTFDSNEAYYGADIASYPKELSITFLTNNDYYNPVDNTRRLLDNTNGFDSLVSGTAF